jgi:hypothetical protein
VRPAAIACALALSLAALRAGAQSAVDQARIYFDAGAQAYAAGRYGAAIEALSAAYLSAPKPQILFSLAQAERRQFTAGRDPRHLRDAVAHFRAYLREVPEGGRRADAVEALAELEAVAAHLALPGEAAPTRQPPATRLMVSSSTSGASVTLDGQRFTELPVLESVKPGKHRLRISAPGYFDEERELTAVEGTLVPLEVTLRGRPSLLALSAPSGAAVTIDGRPFGEAPFAAPIDLLPGSHLVTVTRSGHEPHHAALTVARGETTTLRVLMPRTAQRNASYVVLGSGAAALVAGGVLFAGALHQQRLGQDVLDAARTGNISAARLDAYNGALVHRDQLRTGGFAALAAGGALAITGLALHVFDDPRPRARWSDASVAVGPRGVVVSAAF